MDKLTMGDRIKEVRKKQKLTQEQLAEHLDVSVEFIGQIERGLKLPSMQVFIRLGVWFTMTTSTVWRIPTVKQ